MVVMFLHQRMLRKLLKIQLCKLPLMCSIDLNSIAASEKPADVDYVAKYQKLIAELLYLSVNTMSEIGFVTSCLTRYMTKPTKLLGKYENSKL